MRSFHRLWNLVILLLLLLSCSWSLVDALALPTKKLDDLWKSNPVISKFLDYNDNDNSKEDETSVSRGELLLKELNLTASTEPKTFSVEWQNLPSIVGASLPAIFRLGTGVFAEGYQLNVVDRNPQQYTILPLGDSKQLQESSTSSTTNVASSRSKMKPLILYDRQGSVACRLVREACSILSLTVTIRPCPEKGLQFASKLSPETLSSGLPILQDPNTSIELANGVTTVDDDNPNQKLISILTYLFNTYGNNKNSKVPWTLDLQTNALFVEFVTRLAVLSRLGSGSQYQSSDPPPLPLTLWSYEGSPFCQIVHERLGSLELEHTIRYCPRGSLNRQVLMDESSSSCSSSSSNGRFQVPFLQDPNTGIDLYESAAICEYLEKQYGVRTSVTYL